MFNFNALRRRSAVVALTCFGLAALPSAASAHVGFTAPAAGGTYEPGQTVTLTWEILITHTLQNWDLELSTDGGATYRDVAIDLSPDTLTYDWTVPAIECSACVLRVTMDNAGTDYNAELAFSVAGAAGTDAGGGADAGGAGPGDAGPVATPDAGGGGTTDGGCAIGRASASAIAWPSSVALIGLLVWRRRRS